MDNIIIMCAVVRWFAIILQANKTRGPSARGHIVSLRFFFLKYIHTRLHIIHNII